MKSKEMAEAPRTMIKPSTNRIGNTVNDVTALNAPKPSRWRRFRTLPGLPLKYCLILENITLPETSQDKMRSARLRWRKMTVAAARLTARVMINNRMPIKKSTW